MYIYVNILKQINVVFYAEDFWLGLKKIHSLTRHGAHILRIDVEDWREGQHWAEYHFSVEGPSKHYVLRVGHFSGDLPDAMANATGTRFSTKDTNGDQRNPVCTRSSTGKQFVWFLSTRALWHQYPSLYAQLTSLFLRPLWQAAGGSITAARQI